MSEDVSRRALVCGGCAVIAGCQVTHVTVPPPRTTTGDSGDPVTTDKPTSYPCGQSVPTASDRISLALSDYPALAEVGGAVSINAGGRAVIVARPFEDCFVAMARACTHQGVLIDYRPDRAQFVCPEHGAVYALDGTKVSGPQPRDLPVYQAALDGDVLHIDVTG